MMYAQNIYMQMLLGRCELFGKDEYLHKLLKSYVFFINFSNI